MRVFSSVAGLVVAASALGGPIDLKSIPAQSRAVIHVDIERLVASDLGRMFLQESDAADGLGELRAHLGIDALSDLRDVTVCLIGDDEDDVVILATIDDSLEDAIARLDEHAQEIGHSVEERFGGDWHTMRIDGNRVHALVRPRGDLYRVAISPGSDWVEAVGRTVAGDDESLARRISVPEAPRGTFAQVIAPRVASLPMRDDIPRELLSKVRSMSAQMGEDDGTFHARLDLTMGDEDDATSVMQMGQGLIAMVNLAGSVKDADADLKKVASLVRGLRVSQDGETVTATLRLESGVVRALIREAE